MYPELIQDILTFVESLQVNDLEVRKLLVLAYTEGFNSGLKVGTSVDNDSNNKPTRFQRNKHRKIKVKS
jgi:hypothetical protein